MARTVARDPRFVRAVATADPAALRAQIVRFFQQPQLHVVRIRATTDRRTPDQRRRRPVRARPDHAPSACHGRAIGRVTLSVQDDTGYIKLLHRFTGAQVVLRGPAGLVPGSTVRPRSPLPARGTLTYRGRTYGVKTFDATAFPTGTLAISVLVPN